MEEEEKTWPSDTAMTVLRSELRMTIFEIAEVIERSFGWKPDRLEIRERLNTLDIP